MRGSITNFPKSPRCALLVATLILAFTGHASAQPQTVRVLEPGTRVRVRLAEAHSNVVALLVDARPDTLVLERPSRSIQSRIPLPVSQIQRLEVSAGRRQLAPIGAATGFIVGVGLVSVYNSIRQSQCFTGCPEPTSFVVGGLIGGVVGGVGFAFIDAERWVEVALPRRGGPGRR